MKSVTDYLALLGGETLRSYRSTLMLWLEWLSVPPVAATYEQARAYIAHLKERGCSSGTIRRHYYALNGYYEFLLDSDRIAKNPLRPLKKKIREERVRLVRPTASLGPEDVQKILRYKPQRLADKVLVLLLFGCGLRRGEALKLRVRDVITDSRGTFLHLKECKNGEDRLQPVPPWVASDLRSYISEMNSGERLFPYTEKTLYRRFKRITLTLGITAAPHAARAAFATQLKRQGYEDRNVAAALGHKTVSMVQVYDKRTKLEECAFEINFFKQ